MEQAFAIGAVVLALISIFKLVSAVNSFSDKFTGPLNELRIAIQRLNDSIEHLLKESEVLKDRITKHGQEIDALISRLDKLEMKVEMLHQEVK